LAVLSVSWPPFPFSDFSFCFLALYSVSWASVGFSGSSFYFLALLFVFLTFFCFLALLFVSWLFILFPGTFLFFALLLRFLALVGSGPSADPAPIFTRICNKCLLTEFLCEKPFIFPKSDALCVCFTFFFGGGGSIAHVPIGDVQNP
jgi:hypothetical protein